MSYRMHYLFIFVFVSSLKIFVEANEPRSSQNETTYPSSWVDCGNGRLVALIWRCDGDNDCGNLKDEENCGDVCPGPTCSQKCDNGYEFDADNKTCKDIDECQQEQNNCSQICTNLDGSYKCSCIEGYYAENNTCRVEGQEPILIYSNRIEIRGIYLRSQKNFLVHKAVNRTSVIGTDPTESRVYWIEPFINSSKVYSSKLDGSDMTLVLNEGLVLAEGIAVDYVARNLYFTDSGLKQILVCKMDGTMCHVLHSQNIEKPRSIAVDPVEGWLYWSDWGDTSSGIYRSGMDGSNRSVLVSTNITWPNGITIDYATNRLYWVDAKLETVEYISLNDIEKRVLLRENIGRPYSISVFEDNLYWSLWFEHTIQNYDMFTRQEKALYKENFIFGVDVYHPVLARRSENSCSPNSCSHMCLIKPLNGIQCICPSELHISSNGTNCIDKNCTLEEFQCRATKECVPKVFVCDGRKDCDDGSDENNCDVTGLVKQCPYNDFLCANGRCILSEWKCDHRDDCGDNSDEIGCSNPTTCVRDQFWCPDGVCKPLLWKCDGEEDCIDGSDEKDCNQTVCTEWQLRCDHGQCIPNTWACDGVKDCYDGSDERNCSTKQKTCAFVEFRCDDGSCIHKELLCNQRRDCPDGSDERNCTHFLKQCDGDKFQCKDGFCIYSHEVCDQHRDCSEGEDEVNCNKTAADCTEIEYFCLNNSKCISNKWLCDGDNDCGDGADEEPSFCFIGQQNKNTLPPKDNVNRCFENKCPHLCLPNRSGSFCRCADGYEAHNGTCVLPSESESITKETTIESTMESKMTPTMESTRTPTMESTMASTTESRKNTQRCHVFGGKLFCFELRKYL